MVATVALLIPRALAPTPIAKNSLLYFRLWAALVNTVRTARLRKAIFLIMGLVWLVKILKDGQYFKNNSITEILPLNCISLH
jgi:hypothetical protein